MYCLFLGDPTLTANYIPISNSFFDHFELQGNGKYGLKTADGQYLSQRANRGELIHMPQCAGQEQCYVSDPQAIIGAVSMTAGEESPVRPLYYFQRLA